MTTSTDSKMYPSVDLAYPLAVSSYEVAQKRFDAMNDRLQTVIGFGVTISLAIPVVAASRGLKFSSCWFIAAACFFVLATVVGGAARLYGGLILINPSRLYEKWLHLPEWDFKKDFIFRAGEHFQTNRIMIERKGWAAAVTLLLFILDLAFAAAWAAQI